MPNYNVKTDTHFIDLEAQTPRDLSIKMLKSNPLVIEEFLLTYARIPEIIRNIEGQTVIYTEYVGHNRETSTCCNHEGYTFALYIGTTLPKKTFQRRKISYSSRNSNVYKIIER